MNFEAIAFVTLTTFSGSPPEYDMVKISPRLEGFITIFFLKSSITSSIGSFSRCFRIEVKILNNFFKISPAGNNLAESANNISNP